MRFIILALLLLAGCVETVVVEEVVDSGAPIAQPGPGVPIDQEVPVTKEVAEIPVAQEVAIVPEVPVAQEVAVEAEVNDVTFVVSGEKLRFFMNGVSSPDLVVNQGDTVTILFTAGDALHDWVLDGFGETKQVATGKSSSVTFIADKKGTFEYYCSVGSHRTLGMKGNFIVN